MNKLETGVQIPDKSTQNNVLSNFELQIQEKLHLNKPNTLPPEISTINIKQMENTKCTTRNNQNSESSSSSNLFYKAYDTNNKLTNESFVIAKFEIYEEVFATKLKTTTVIKKIQEDLADVLELQKNLIILLKDNIKVDEANILADLIAPPSDKIKFQISSPNGESGKALILAKVKENLPTLDVITTHNINRQGDVVDIIVEIDNQSCQKEWLGGYRNKLTNVDYHHAASQTAPKQRTVFKYTVSGEAIPLIYHRDSQTPFKPKDTINDTTVDKSTQMWKTDLFIHSKGDRIITAKPYSSYEEWYKENNVEQIVITIQRAVRKWIYQRKFKRIISLHKVLLEDVKKQKAQIFKEQVDKERQIITNASYPVNRDDFYTLYLMVEKWWKREWKRICDLRSTEPKKAEAALLLHNEIKLLENIEKHRIVGKKEALKKERMRFLERSARPFTFKNQRGKMISIDDSDTQRAREFKEIYSALTSNNFVSKDRIDLLTTLKHLFESNFMDYEYTNDFISLIEREIDLLTIGTKAENLKGLHKRIEQLYMNFMEQNEFNPKAEKYIKPNFPKTIHDFFQCSRCFKMLPASKFPVHVRMRKYSECKSCTWLKNIGHQRVDMSPYLKLLKRVQNSEMQECCHSAVCFILQPIGMGYLTNVIWHGHSAISECRDISKLQHIRWISDVEWAPWNTILLTDQEAKCHASIPDVFQFYDKIFIETVRQKHIQARQQFLPLLKIDHEIRSSGAWSSIKDSGPFLHPSHAEELAFGEDYDKI